jgi:hypothetical protein
MRELMGRMRAWPPSTGRVRACPTGRRVADEEEERLATKDSAHTADLRNLASDPGGGARKRGVGIGRRRPLEEARDSKGHGAALAPVTWL